MIHTPPELDAFVDAALAYRPPKKKKKLKAIAKNAEKKKKKPKTDQ